MSEIDIKKMITIAQYPPSLASLDHPSRYIGNEINIIKKDDRNISLRFALVFPDLYEIGMSHIGLRILYNILNKMEGIYAERVFYPGEDLEGYIRSKRLSLTSLESGMPLHQFDVIGFTLQYELSYTNILHILDMAGIRIRSEDRGEIDPLIIGGGPCALNPEPLSPFFDLFIIGDGEEVIAEIATLLLECRRSSLRRAEILAEMAKLKGVYVPTFFNIEYEDDGAVNHIVSLHNNITTIHRRVVHDLDNAPYPEKPIIPYAKLVHDRVAIEIARGCTQGCRFCQAGYIYRPVRERGVKKILELVKKGIVHTGYEEISLVSLSSGDYPDLNLLLSSMIKCNYMDYTTISFPSLRSDIDKEIISILGSRQKAGFTIAVEAGTQRLRDIINKKISEEVIIDTVSHIIKTGWRSLKIYFMIGLPLETDEDIDGIYQLCDKVIKHLKYNKLSLKNINIGISTFVPKSHTPFQWVSQISLEESINKIEILKDRFRSRKFSLKWHDPYMSVLEGVFSRGDRRLAKVLEYAYRFGCKMDGWSESFNFDLWLKAFDAASIDIWAKIKGFDIVDRLPWDHINAGIKKEFLAAEFKNAMCGRVTPDCRASGCIDCGISLHISSRDCSNSSNKGDISPAIPLYNNKKSHDGYLNLASKGSQRRFRVCYRRGYPLSLLSHLELNKVIIRAIRRSGIAVAYSDGYNPQPKIAFGYATPVGYESDSEYIDIIVTNPLLSPQKLCKLVNTTLPQGIVFREAVNIPLNSDSIQSQIKGFIFSIDILGGDFIKSKDIIDILTEKERTILDKKNCLVNIGDIIYDISLNEDGAVIFKINKEYNLLNILELFYKIKKRELFNYIKVKKTDTIWSVKV